MSDIENEEFKLLDDLNQNCFSNKISKKMQIFILIFISF